MPIKKEKKDVSAELNAQPNNKSTHSVLSETEENIEDLQNSGDENSNPIEELPYSKNRDGLDISFIENESYRKFLSRTNEFFFTSILGVMEIYNKWKNNQLYDQNGKCTVRFSPFLQTTMCFSCIVKSKYRMNNNQKLVSLKIAIADSYIVTFEFPASLDNKYYKELVRCFGVGFDINILEGIAIYIELLLDKDDPNAYVKKFRFMNRDFLNCLQQALDAFVDGRDKIPKAHFTLFWGEELTGLYN